MSNTTVETATCGNPGWIKLLDEAEKERFTATPNGVRQRHAYIATKCDKEDIVNYDKEKEQYVFKQEVHNDYIVDENKKTVTAGSIRHTSKLLTVALYDQEKDLYIDLICNMLIFSPEKSKPIAVGYLLDGKITPLSDELKRIASVLRLRVSDTHFDEQLKVDSAVTKDDASCVIS